MGNNSNRKIILCSYTVTRKKGAYMYMNRERERERERQTDEETDK